MLLNLADVADVDALIAGAPPSIGPQCPTGGSHRYRTSETRWWAVHRCDGSRGRTGRPRPWNTRKASENRAESFPGCLGRGLEIDSESSPRRFGPLPGLRR